MKNKEEKRLWLITISLIIGSIVLISAQFLFSSDIRYDRQTIKDLEDIEDGLRETGDMVTSVDELTLPSAVQARAEERNYTVTFIREESEKRFVYEICAEFKRDTEDSQRYEYYQPFSSHSSGTDCFERDIYIMDLAPTDRETIQ